MTIISKSIIITLAGYIIGSTLGYFVIYPLFNISVSISSMLLLGLIFTGVSLLANYCSLKAIEYFEKEKE